MTDPTKELAFQNDVIAQMEAAGWKLCDRILRPKRRTALISAFVTGKIDVQHGQSPVVVSILEHTTPRRSVC